MTDPLTRLPFDPLKLAVAVLLALAGWSYVEARTAESRADTFRAERERIEAHRDSVIAEWQAAQRRQTRRNLIAADSLARLEAENRRMRAAREAERREAEARAVEARERSDSLSAAIVDAVTGPEKPVVEELVAEKDAEAENERRAHTAQVASLTAQLTEERTLWQAEADVLRGQVADANARADAADRVIHTLREDIRLLNAENDALRDARGAGLLSRLKWAGLGGVVGAIGWEAAR